MADHLTDEEQLQQLKNWWKENGTSLIVAVSLALTVYFGHQWWQNNQQQQAEQASVVYSNLLEIVDPEQPRTEALSEENKTTAEYLVKQLQDEYSSSLYAANASLYAAKIAVADGNLDGAKDSLQWIINNGHTDMVPLASLRLARVLLAQEKYDEAAKLVSNEKTDLYVSLKAEVRGDIFVAKGEWDKARAAYKEAINTLGDSVSYRSRLLPIKLANLPLEGQ